MELSKVFADPLLLGASFAGPSWDPWRVLLAGAFGLTLAPQEAELFRQFTARDPLTASASELWVIAGRRAGKSRIAAGLAVALAACRDWPRSVGEVPVVLYLASDRDQAQVAFRYARGLLAASPLLSREVEAETKDRIVLRSGVELQVATSDYRRVRGRSVAVAVLDEVAFWEASPEVANPDTEVLAALRPSLATFADSLLIAISSPYAQRGVLFDTFRRSFGKDDPRVLVARAPTRLLNPTVPQEVIDDALARDPAAASAEWLAEFRSDVASFLDAPLVDSLIRAEPRELPRLAQSRLGTPLAYVAAVDVSGGRGDAAAAAVAHSEDGRAVVDACRRWPAPHDPAVVARDVAAFLQGYGLRIATADRYGAEVSRALYAEAGVTLLDAPVTRSDAYLALLPVMTSGRVELPPEPVLRVELIGLERRTARSGRDSVDHRPGAHDDLANAVALAVHGCTHVGVADIRLLTEIESGLFDDLHRPSGGHDWNSYIWRVLNR